MTLFTVTILFQFHICGYVCELTAVGKHSE